MSAQGGGSYGKDLYIAATTNLWTGQDDTDAAVGFDLDDTTFTSQVIGVPFPLKGAGLAFMVNTASYTAGSVQPKLQVTFDWDAETATWWDVPEDAGTTTAVQLSAALTQDEAGFEWYGLHIPGSWRVGSHTTSGDVGTTTASAAPQRGNVALRVAFVGSSTDLQFQHAQLFLIESISRGS